MSAKRSPPTHFCINAPVFWESLQKCSEDVAFTDASVQTLRILHLSFLQIVAKRLVTYCDEEDTNRAISIEDLHKAFASLPDFQSLFQQAHQAAVETTTTIAKRKSSSSSQKPSKRSKRKPSKSELEEMERAQEQLLTASKNRAAKQC